MVDFDCSVTKFDIAHIFTRARNPQANGNAERTVQTVQDKVCKYALCNPDSWADQLSQVRMASIHSVH